MERRTTSTADGEDALLTILGHVHRDFTHLSSIARKRLIDGLCSNLSVLGLSVSALLSVQEPDDVPEHEAAALSHRSALKAYVFLLAWLTRLAEEEAKNSTAADAQAGALLL